ncbi:carbohydrate kinase [Pseudodesulfovibrio sp.]|uniref:carbohydrate kinase family protein n=1 Tax=Pseudodesulfovibrio sp. TaxID=2035812 RepID=UPI00261A739C|nr:carbohydrate kinase [Pseudodesulfovibrio sp.]MDD3311293.1 carbohydrate kinase [Pseudodesulfovibrio sp.]
MPDLTAIGLGEILWDVLPDRSTLGGAPANFAYHVNALGGTGVPLSRIGDDKLGRQTLDALLAKNVSTRHLSLDPDHPTGTVLAKLDPEGVATYTFPDNVAWDFLAPTPDDLLLAARADIICFGTLAQRSPASRQAVRTVLRHAPQALKIFDANLRQHFWDSATLRTSLALADVLKLNDAELDTLTTLFCLPQNPRAAMETLLHRYDLKLAVLTRGPHGSLVLSPQNASDLPGQPTPVADTIGAGDAFTAAMALAYLHGQSTDQINRYAANVAANVCAMPGAMPDMPRELRIDAQG